MSDQITLLEITDIGKEGIGFKFHGLKHFNDKWFSWAAISKAILHREDEIIIDQKCTMPNYKQLQSQVEQLQADNARLREAIEDALPTLKSEEKHSSLITRTLQEAIASTDGSNWLAEQKAQWRREVLEEAAEGWDTQVDHSASTIRTALRRMAEQPESNCACYPDDKDADKRQCNECQR